MKRLFLIFWLLPAILIAGPFGTGGSGVTTVSDTTGAPKMGKIYFSQSDSTYYTWGAGGFWTEIGSGGGLLNSSGTTAVLPVAYDSLVVTGSIRCDSLFTQVANIDTVETTYQSQVITDSAFIGNTGSSDYVEFTGDYLDIHIDSPASGSTIFNVETSDAVRFKVDEDGNTTVGSNIYLPNNGTIGGAAENSWIQFTGSVIYAQQNADISAGDFFKLGPTGTDDELTASSGDQNFFLLEPEINQTSTASYAGIRLDVTETGTGSGDNYLLDLQVGSTSKFSIDNSGNATMAGLTATGEVSLQNYDAPASPVKGDIYFKCENSADADTLLLYNGTNWKEFISN